MLRSLCLPFYSENSTLDSHLQYLGAKTRAEAEVRDRYASEITELKERITSEKAQKVKVKAAILSAEKRLQEIENCIIEEAKPLIKEYFDYEIPVAMVEDAGITSTGAYSGGNQLPQLQKEYSEYKASHHLWNSNVVDYQYGFNSDGGIARKKGSDGEGVNLRVND